jgi:ABC-type sugar transport systems, permease components
LENSLNIYRRDIELTGYNSVRRISWREFIWSCRTKDKAIYSYRDSSINFIKRGVKMKVKNSATKLERKNYKWIYLFLLPSFIVFITFYIQPIFTVIYTSFTKWDGFNTPKFIGLSNYINLFHNAAFIYSLKNLLLWSVIASFLHVGFGVLVAFAIFKKPYGWKFTRAVFMIPNVISAAAWAMIYRFMFHDDMGMINNFIRRFNPNFHIQWFYKSPYAFIAVTLTWLFYAVIVTLIVLNDLLAIPTELFEAARVDGASDFQIIKYIQLPLCRNAIGTAVIASVTARVAMYEQIALTTAGGPGDDTMNLPVILVKSILDLKYGYANANGVIMFILGLVILWLVNKMFRMNESVY